MGIMDNDNLTIGGQLNVKFYGIKILLQGRRNAVAAILKRQSSCATVAYNFHHVLFKDIVYNISR